MSFRHHSILIFQSLSRPTRDAFLQEIWCHDKNFSKFRPFSIAMITIASIPPMKNAREVFPLSLPSELRAAEYRNTRYNFKSTISTVSCRIYEVMLIISKYYEGRFIIILPYSSVIIIFIDDIDISLKCLDEAILATHSARCAFACVGRLYVYLTASWEGYITVRRKYRYCYHYFILLLIIRGSHLGGDMQ